MDDQQIEDQLEQWLQNLAKEYDECDFGNDPRVCDETSSSYSDDSSSTTVTVDHV